MKLKTGALIAVAAGSLFATACKKEEPTPPAKPAPTETKPAIGTTAEKPAEKTAAKIHCGGVNGCSGQGACAGEANSCAGKNGCAGKGFTELTADECTAKNGSVLATKK